MKRSHVLLLMILSFALAIRLFLLGEIPAGFTPDESSQAYSAYSLLKTGKDEWGIKWPLLSFRSFADYKAPLQTYLMIPSIAIFGLTEFATRLPSAIFGTLAIFAIYLLANELFPELKIRLKNKDITIGHLSALVLSITPWHLQFSRMALEANLISFLFPLGLYFFLKSLKDSNFLIYSSLVWGISLYSYHAAKLFVPLFAIVVGLLFFKQIKAIKLTKLMISLLIFSFFLLPLYGDLILGKGGTRSGDLFISRLSLQQVEQVANEQYLSPLNQLHPQVARIFHNKLTFIINEFATNYISYFTPSFWFTEGGRETTYSVIPGRGLLYLWQLPLIVVGIIALTLSNSSQRKVIFAWLLLAAIPAALTKEGYRPNRAASFLGLWSILTSLGLIRLFMRVQSNRLKPGLILACLFISFFSFVFYLEDYAISAPIRFPNSLSYGYRDLVHQLVPAESKFDQIIIDRGTQSQSMVAFYKKMDPRIFQSYSHQWWDRFSKTDFLYLDMLDNYQLDKYTFKTVDLENDLKLSKTLIVIPASKYQPQYQNFIYGQVNYPDRSPAFYILESKPTLHETRQTN